MSPKALHSYYAGLNVTDAYFGNVAAQARFAVRREWDALGRPVDRAEWQMTAPTVNAYYNPAGNEIVFPAGIMQFPAFGDPDRLPSYVSYGGFGSVAGHELSHAFDSSGRHYDERGRLADWWTPATVEAFEARAACFVDQYSNFSVPDPSS